MQHTQVKQRNLVAVKYMERLVALMFPSSRLIFHYIQLDLRRHFYLTPEG